MTCVVADDCLIQIMSKVLGKVVFIVFILQGVSYAEENGGGKNNIIMMCRPADI